MENQNSANTVSDKYLFDKIDTELSKLLAIMTLEFHDKNHLSGSDASRNVVQREMVIHSMQCVQDLKIRFLPK